MSLQPYYFARQKIFLADRQVLRPAMVIDCEEIAKAKNDAGLVSALADQTGELLSPSMQGLFS